MTELVADKNDATLVELKEKLYEQTQTQVSISTISRLLLSLGLTRKKRSTPQKDKLSPGRVAQAFPLILAAISTPARPPKTHGKSPGRVQGHQPPSRPCYPTVKKHASKKPKTEESPKESELTAA